MDWSPLRESHWTGSVPPPGRRCRTAANSIGRRQGEHEFRRLLQAMVLTSRLLRRPQIFADTATNGWLRDGCHNCPGTRTTTKQTESHNHRYGMRAHQMAASRRTGFDAKPCYEQLAVRKSEYGAIRPGGNTHTKFKKTATQDFAVESKRAQFPVEQGNQQSGTLYNEVGVQPRESS